MSSTGRKIILLDPDDALEPRANNGLIEQRAHAMLLDRMRGLSDREIGDRYGLADLGEVDSLIRGVIDDLLARRDHRLFQAGAIEELIQLDRELAELDAKLPLVGQRSFQVVDKFGEEHTLVEDESNVPAKIKIKAERRQNVLARKVILGADTGEQVDSGEQREVARITSAITDIAKTVMGEMADALKSESREVGRLEAERLEAEREQDDKGRTIDVPAREVEDE